MCPEDLTNFGAVSGLEICLWPDYDRFINTHTEYYNTINILINKTRKNAKICIYLNVMVHVKMAKELLYCALSNEQFERTESRK